MRYYIILTIGLLIMYYMVFFMTKCNELYTQPSSTYIRYNNITNLLIPNNTQPIQNNSLRSDYLYQSQIHLKEVDLPQDRIAKDCTAVSKQFNTAPRKHVPTFLHLKDVCFSRSQNGQVIISSYHGNTLRRFCRNNLLDICLPNYVHGVKKTCPAILCEYRHITQLTPLINKTLNVLSGKMNHFGWHAVFDNFIHYYYTWMCQKHMNCGKTTIDTESCSNGDAILFVDMNRNCKNTETALFLFHTLVGQSNDVIDLDTNHVECYANAQIGRIDAPFKYNELLRRFPRLFTSLAKCAFISTYDMNKYSNQDSNERLNLIFINREISYGPRHIVDLETIASTVRSKYSYINVSYYDGLSLLSMKQQFDIFNQRFAIVVSPHGSQLTWILFLKPASTVVEIFGEDPTYIRKTDYYDISRAVNLTYVRWNAYGGYSRSQEKYKTSRIEKSTFIGNSSYFLQGLASIINKYHD